jgi:hypothetical protein
MEPEVVIRLADEQDLDTIRAFGAVVVPAHYDPIIGPAAAQEQVDLWWPRERLLAALSDGVLLVVEADDELVPATSAQQRSTNARVSSICAPTLLSAGSRRPQPSGGYSISRPDDDAAS